MQMRQKLRVNLALLRSIATRAVSQMRQAEIGLHASALSFSTAVSIIPLMGVMFAGFYWLGGVDKWMKVVQPFILHNLVENSGASGLIQFDLGAAIRRAVRRAHNGKLGWIGFVGLIATSLALFFKMERAVLKMTASSRQRSLWKRALLYLFVLLVSPLLLAGVLLVANSRWLTGLHIPLIEGLSAVIAFSALFALYRWVPTVKIQNRAAAIGAFVATALLAGAQEFYAQAMKSLFRFSKLYGSLAGFPLLMFWIYVLWWCVLFGVALTTVINSSKMPKHV